MAVILNRLGISLVIIFMLIVGPVLSTVKVFGQSFTEPLNLSNSTFDSDCQQIKIVNSNVYVVWSDSSLGGGDIFFKKSTDGGNTFGSTVDLSDNLGEQAGCPEMATSGKNIYIVWNEGTNSGSFDVFFRRSTDSGTSFGPTKNLSNNKGDSCCPQISFNGKKIYVVWDDDTPPDFNPFYSHSTDSGKSFAKAKNLIQKPLTEGLNAQVAVSGKYVYVVWTGSKPGDSSDIFMRISKDGGKKFGTTINLSKNDGSSGSRSHSLLASGSNVYVTWQDDSSGNQEILFKRSTNKGSTFDKAINLSNNDGNSLDPIMITQGGHIYLVWTDDSLGDDDIMYRRSIDKGSTFESTINLSHDEANSVDPTISANANNVYLAWISGEFGHGDILLRTSTDGGIEFGGPVNISHSPGGSHSPRLASADGTLYVTWSEILNSVQSDIFFVKSTSDPFAFVH